MNTPDDLTPHDLTTPHCMSTSGRHKADADPLAVLVCGRKPGHTGDHWDDVDHRAWSDDLADTADVLPFPTKDA